MIRPEVRVLDNQVVTTSEPLITQAEADALLAKYGYKQNYQSNDYIPEPPKNNLTFEEMAKMEEEKQRRVEEENFRRMNGPTPITFDGGQVKYAETKWSSIEDTNIGIQVQIVTDMKF